MKYKLQVDIMKIMRGCLNKIFSLLLLVFFCLVCIPLLSGVRADELEEIEKELGKLEESLQMSIQATAPLESTLNKMEKDLKNLQDRIGKLEIQAKNKEIQVEKGEKNLGEQQSLLEQRIRVFYKKKFQFTDTGIQFLLAESEDISATIRQLTYNQAVVDRDRSKIVQMVLYIKNLEEKKKELEQEKVKLASLRKGIDKQADFFRQEVKGAKEYQKELSKKIAELSARQQQLLAEKTELFSTSVGEVPLADDPASRPDYNPGFSPAFAAFSFGAPHYKGMSQYGAFGRSKEGQGVEEILKAYYGNIRLETVDTNFDMPTTIGAFSFEDNYLKGLAEMPAKWADEGGFNALKAQAIAARSYALAYTGWRMGDRSVKSAICVTEACQVYKAGKAADPGRWADAVNETRGQILVSNNSNEVVNAWYASTSGGYQVSYSSLGHSTPGFWDTKNGRDGWTSQAYEKIAGSPWFYKGWYKTRSGTNCGRAHPWLTEQEFIDIINAVIVYANGGDTSGLFPQDVRSCFGGSDNPWDNNRLAEEAAKYTGRITSVSNVKVVYSTDGTTAKVEVSTNQGALNFDGNKFYKGFNLRAPGAIHIKSDLFNLEKK